MKPVRLVLIVATVYLLIPLIWAAHDQARFEEYKRQWEQAWHREHDVAKARACFDAEGRVSDDLVSRYSLQPWLWKQRWHHDYFEAEGK